MLENKLGITSSVELANEEERITKLKALELFDTNKIEEYEIGTFQGLSSIHKFLFNDIYSFAGKIRNENIAKGNFRFALDLCQVFRHNFSRFSYFKTASYLNLFQFPFDKQKYFY